MFMIATRPQNVPPRKCFFAFLEERFGVELAVRDAQKLECCVALYQRQVGDRRDDIGPCQIVEVSTLICAVPP